MWLLPLLFPRYSSFGRVTTTNFPSALSESYAAACPERIRGNALNRLTQKLYPD